MDTLTTELKRAIEQAGDAPVVLTDPDTQQVYVLVSAKVYEALLESAEDEREQAAFRSVAKKNATTRLREDS